MSAHDFTSFLASINCEKYLSAFVANYADSLAAWCSFNVKQIYDNLTKIGVDNFFKRKRFVRSISTIQNPDSPPLSAFHAGALPSKLFHALLS